MSEKDFMNSWKNAKDRWETEKIQIYDLTPTVISNLIRLKKWNPASVAATRASLIFRYPDANLTLNSRLKG
jgi:hypothetical protein